MNVYSINTIIFIFIGYKTISYKDQKKKIF